MGICLHIHLWTTCVTGTEGGESLLVLRTEPGSLQQQVLLTTDPILQPWSVIFKRCKTTKLSKQKAKARPGDAHL